VYRRLLPCVSRCPLQDLNQQTIANSPHPQYNPADMSNRLSRADEEAVRGSWYLVGLAAIVVSVVLSIYGILR
jgi:hypothetical protein